MPESTAAPSDRALHFTIETDRATLSATALAAAGERVHFVVDVTASAAGVETSRSPLSAVFVLDVSGSMAGPPL
jgi:Mg-chelatase subunit ChlD